MWGLTDQLENEILDSDMFPTYAGINLSNRRHSSN